MEYWYTPKVFFSADQTHTQAPSGLTLEFSKFVQLQFTAKNGGADTSGHRPERGQVIGAMTNFRPVFFSFPHQPVWELRAYDGLLID